MNLWIISIAETISAEDEAKLLSDARKWCPDITIENGFSHCRTKDGERRRFGFYWQNQFSYQGQPLTRQQADAWCATFAPNVIWMEETDNPTEWCEANGWKQEEEPA